MSFGNHCDLTFIKTKDLGCLHFFHVLDSFPPWLSTSQKWRGSDWARRSIWMRSGCSVCVQKLRAPADWLGDLLHEPVCGPMKLSLEGEPLCSHWVVYSTHDRNAIFCCKASGLRRALADDFTCIISLNPPHHVCCLKATSNHTRKWFPKSFRFAVLWKMRKYFHYLESNSLGQWIFQYDINRPTFSPSSSWS